MFQELNNKKDIKFKDIMNIKSGIDSFSKLKYNQLIQDISLDIINDVNNLFINDLTNVNKVLRWFKRGLTLELSIRKVKTELEIMKNCKIRKRKQYQKLFEQYNYCN